MTSGLTSTDIVKIIGSCAKNGVTSIKFGDLDIKFGEQPVEYVATTTPDGYWGAVRNTNPVENTEEIGDTKDTEVRDMVTEEEISELMVSNPLDYIEMMNDA